MSNRYFTVLGVDPSISHFGLVYGVIDSDTLEFFPLLTKVLKDEVDKKQFPHLNATQLKAYKSWEISRQLHTFLKQRYNFGDIAFEIKPDILIFELANGSNKAFTDASLSCAKGVVTGVFSALPIRRLVMPSTPKVKTTTGNPNNATKEQMIAWAVQKYGVGRIGLETEDLRIYVRDVGDNCYNAPYGTYTTVSYNEHIADALAVVEAGLQKERTKEFIRNNAEKLGKEKDKLFNYLVEWWKDEKVRVFQDKIQKVAEGIKRVWSDETNAYGIRVLNPHLTTLKPTRFGERGEVSKDWDSWTNQNDYANSCKYESSKISAVYKAYNTREVFFTDAVIIEAIRKLGYTEFLSFFGLFDLKYEERVKGNVEKLKVLPERLSMIDAKTHLAIFKSVDPSKASLKRLISVTSEEERFECLAGLTNTTFKNVFETLDRYIKTMHAEEKRFIDESLFILRWFCDENLLSIRLRMLEDQAKGESSDVDYKSYFLEESKLLQAFLSCALIAQKGANKFGEHKKEAKEAVERLIDDFGLTGKARFNTETLQLEKVAKPEKKKTGPKPKAKVEAPSAPIAPKRGRGRPKGSKNKKTLEIERLRKEKEEAEEKKKKDKEFQEILKDLNRSLGFG